LAGRRLTRTVGPAGKRVVLGPDASISTFERARFLKSLALAPTKANAIEVWQRARAGSQTVSSSGRRYEGATPLGATRGVEQWAAIAVSSALAWQPIAPHQATHDYQLKREATVNNARAQPAFLYYHGFALSSKFLH
jgi:hypothetical protein